MARENGTVGIIIPTLFQINLIEKNIRHIIGMYIIYCLQKN